MSHRTLKAAFVCVVALLSASAFASSTKQVLTDLTLSHDQASMQRGAILYFNNCRLCHDMKYVTYQSLMDIGFNKNDIDRLRGNHPLADSLKSTNSPEISVKLFGMSVPDLSLMTKARKHGPEYIFTLLSSYYENDNGKIENTLFQGIKMPDPLAYSTALNDEERVSIKKDIKDVVEFLYWAADPHASKRKSMGIYVIAYLLILSGLFYLMMKRVWARLDTPVTTP